MDSARAAARRLYEEAWCGVDSAAIEEVVGRGYLGHVPAMEPLHGREGLAEFLAAWRRGFPDLTVTVDDQFAEGERVVSVLTIRGTHTGRFQGMAATGRRVALSAVALSHVRQATVTEEWLEWDRRRLLEELGLVPVLT
jgi:predicted ester cyclase